MGCGCAKRMAKNNRKKQALIDAKNKKKGSIIRKRRVSKLISVPGASSRRKTEGN